METENYYDTISDNIATSPAKNNGQTQRIYIQVSIPDINMKVIKPISITCIFNSFTTAAVVISTSLVFNLYSIFDYITLKFEVGLKMSSILVTLQAAMGRRRETNGS